ncbi:MAG: DUF11 domain-containing protein, partial [Anaerolineae bacterium]|nr:DUF11 domain-containing protein [Anaerolineae bacterium]
TNQGTVTLAGTGSLNLYSGARIDNRAGAAFDLQADASLIYVSGAACAFDNAAGATLTKSGGGGASTISAALNNSGAVQVDSGTLSLTGGGSSGGAFTATAGCTLRFGGGTHALDGAALGGDGVVELIGGTLNVDGAVSASSLTQTGGTLTGDGALTFSGNFNRSGGTFTAGTGTIAFDGGALQNLNLAVATAFYDLYAGSGATLVEVVAADNATVSHLLDNRGVIRKTQAIAAATLTSFGLTAVKMDVTALGSLSSAQVDRIDADHPNAGLDTKSGRYWTISPTGDGYSLDLTLPHSLVEPSMALVCHETGGGWDCDRSAYTDDTVTRAGLADVAGDWTVGYPVVEVGKAAVDLNGGRLFPRDVISYTILITNSYNFPVPGVIISDTIPISTTYVWDSDEPEADVETAALLAWQNLVIAPGVSRFTFQVTVDKNAAGQVVTNTAWVQQPEVELLHSPPAEPPGGGTVQPFNKVYLPLVLRQYP